MGGGGSGDVGWVGLVGLGGGHCGWVGLGRWVGLSWVGLGWLGWVALGWIASGKRDKAEERRSVPPDSTRTLPRTASELVIACELSSKTLCYEAQITFAILTVDLGDSRAD